MTGSYNSKIDLKSNLKAPDAIRDWGEQGLALLCRVLDMTPWGATFGWKAFVRDCHTAPEKKGIEQVHVGRIDHGQRFLTVVVHPRDSQYVFDVDVRTVRTDVTFNKMADAIQSAVHAYVNPPRPVEKTPPPAVPVATVATPPVPASTGPVDLNQLLNMRNNLDRLLGAGKGLNDAAALKADAAKLVDAARSAEREAYLHLTEADEKAKHAASLYKTACERVDELDRKLRNAIVDRDTFTRERDAANEQYNMLGQNYAPLKAALEAALANLAEAEKMEADQLAVVGQSDQLKALLMALAQMPNQSNPNGKG